MEGNNAQKEDKFFSSENSPALIAITGIVALGSTKPKLLGGFLIAMSLVPIAYFVDSPSLVGGVVAGVTAGWGSYNINDLDKGDYSEGEIFRRNMAIPVGAIVLGSGANWLLKKSKPDTKANINITPLADGAVLSLSSRF